jgi:hypothetical protein
MAFDVLGLGTVPGDGTGDDLVIAGGKINDNFAKAVEGAASVTANRVAVFNGTTGKLVKEAAFVEADVARLSETQTFSGAKTFSALVTGAKFAPTGTSAAGNGMYLPAADAVAFSTDGAERVRISATGNVGIGTNAPTVALDVDADTVRLRDARTPASASATGAVGEICWDADYIYVCVATDTWKRAAIATWP